MLFAHLHRLVLSVGVAALLGSLNVPARGATTTYGNGGSSNTYTGGGIIPGDTVLLNDGATVTGDITDNGTLQFNQSAGNTLTISNLIDGTGTLSLTNTGTLNLTGTSVSANTIVLDMTTSASSGLLQIRSGTGSLWVGDSGTGTLNVNGGLISNGTSILGNAAAGVGTATVSSGTWANSGSLTVGGTGTGTLNVNGGSVMNTQGRLGNDAGSVGTANVSSGTWASSLSLTVGSSGTGTLNVTGGRVSNTTGQLGNNAGGVGTATVSSGTWANSGNLNVGLIGTGTLNVTGGYVNNTSGTLGLNAGSLGTATVSSGTWANSSGLTVGSSGTGTLNVTGGYVSNTSGTLGRSAGSLGTATVSSGTWANSGSLTVGGTGNGTLNVNGGYVSSAAGNVGQNSGSVGTATVSSGTWANSGNLTVGASGTGTLTMNGGLISASTASIGSNFDGVGTATVSGGRWNNDSLSIGGNGVGILNVTGGYVRTTGGASIGASGTVTVSSGTWAITSGMSVNRSGALTMSGGLVTVSGTLNNAAGTVNLTSGGTLQIGGLRDDVTNNGMLIFNNSVSSTYSGDLSGSGTVTKQGGGTLTLSGSNSHTGGTTINDGVLQVGAGGTMGSIVGNVVNNAALTFNRSDAYTSSGDISGTGYLEMLGSGTLTLTGSNSYTGGTTITDGVLALGNADAVGTSGTISFDGGTLQYSASNTNDYSSRFGTSPGQAYEIDTNGQNVTFASPLTSTSGTLTKIGSGTLALSGNNSYTGGTTINEGLLQVGAAGTTGSISGDVVNNATIAFNRSDALTYSGVISGTGTIQNAGTGTTTLTGQTSYAVPLVATAGRLIVGSTASFNGLSITGPLAAASGATLELRSKGLAYVNVLSTLTGGTIRAANGISLGAVANVVGTGAISGDVAAANGSWIEADGGKLTLGNASSYIGFVSDGRLSTNANEIELQSRGLAAVNGLATMTGGTLRAANGISLGSSANVVGRGAVSGDVSAAYGSWIEADGGKLTIGNASSYVGFASDGRLYTNANEVELLDRNLAVLGALTQLGDVSGRGTLRAANGMLLPQGNNLAGRGTVYGNFVNQGDVYGDGSTAGQEIVFAAGSTVSGIGSFENVVFNGTYSPGNSPAITNVTNGQFAAASSLLIELGGTQPGTQYDRVVDSGSLTLLGGTLDVVLYNGFVPTVGNSFEILQYGQLSGDFGTVNYPALSGGLSWERTISAVAMTITVVPEPSTWASLLAGLACGSYFRFGRRRAD